MINLVKVDLEQCVNLGPVPPDHHLLATPDGNLIVLKGSVQFPKQEFKGQILQAHHNSLIHEVHIQNPVPDNAYIDPIPAKVEIESIRQQTIRLLLTDKSTRDVKIGYGPLSKQWVRWL